MGVYSELFNGLMNKSFEWDSENGVIYFLFQFSLRDVFALVDFNILLILCMGL